MSNSTLLDVRRLRPRIEISAWFGATVVHLHARHAPQQLAESA